jgi:hypothetical protein
MFSWTEWTRINQAEDDYEWKKNLLWPIPGHKFQVSDNGICLYIRFHDRTETISQYKSWIKTW